VLLLLDAPGMWFRAFYGVKTESTTTDGISVNAVRGFFDALARMLRDNRPSDLVVCIDQDWRPAWRVELVPSYKTHRVAEGAGPVEEEVPDDLSPQVDAILEICADLELPILGLPDCEADDVIGTFATITPGEVRIVTGDRDLLQLVSPHVTVLYSVEQLKAYGPAEVAAKYAIPGTAYADFALLRGDASDGLPGVKGVGDKTASALITAFGSAEVVLAKAKAGPLEGFSPGIRQKVLDAEDYLKAAAPVVRVLRDAPVPVGFDTAVPAPVALPASATRWNAEASVQRVLDALRYIAGG
jgi:5'-3' exonuclease